MKTGPWCRWKTLEGESRQWTIERHRELWNTANTFCHDSTGQRISSVGVTGTLCSFRYCLWTGQGALTVFGDLNPWGKNLPTPMAGEMWVTEHRANKHLHHAHIVAVAINSCYCSQISDKLQTRKSQWCQEGAFLYIWILLSVLCYVVPDLWHSKWVKSQGSTCIPVCPRLLE